MAVVMGRLVESCFIGVHMQTVGSTFEARYQNGVTLIEVLIVTVIIGILAAIAVPQFAAIKEKAYDRIVMSDIKRAQVAAEAYYVGRGIRVWPMTSTRAARTYTGTWDALVVARTPGSVSLYSAWLG